jgi:hypothetical protein
MYLAEGRAPVDPALGSVGRLNATGGESSFGGMKVW